MALTEADGSGRFSLMTLLNNFKIIKTYHEFFKKILRNFNFFIDIITNFFIIESDNNLKYQISSFLKIKSGNFQ